MAFGLKGKSGAGPRKAGGYVKRYAKPFGN